MLFPVFAHDMTRVYRESYGLFAVNGILLTMNLHRGFLQQKNF